MSHLSLMTAPPTTRFASLPPWAAALVLGATVAVLAWGLYLCAVPEPPAPTGPKQPISDWEFYRQISARVHNGQSYYEALPAMFEFMKYRPTSRFNFRAPTYAWVIGGLPDPLWAQLMLNILALAALVLMYFAVRRAAGWGYALAGSLLLLGGLAWSPIPDAVYAQEQWAAVLITLSLGAYGLRCWPLGVVAGLAALFFRELTLPYCGLALLFAVGKRGWGEVVSWLVGLGAYGLFLAWHYQQVAQILPASEGGGALDWVTFGGLRFLLTTARMNFVLLLSSPPPNAPWLTAIYLPFAALGLAGWRGELGARTALTVAAYLGAFSIVGQPMNIYWGLMYTPLLCMGLAWAPASLRALIAATARKAASG